MWGWAASVSSASRRSASAPLITSPVTVRIVASGEYSASIRSASCAFIASWKATGSSAGSVNRAGAVPRDRC